MSWNGLPDAVGCVDNVGEGEMGGAVMVGSGIADPGEKLVCMKSAISVGLILTSSSSPLATSVPKNRSDYPTLHYPILSTVQGIQSTHLQSIIHTIMYEGALPNH